MKKALPLITMIAIIAAVIWLPYYAGKLLVWMGLEDADTWMDLWIFGFFAVFGTLTLGFILISLLSVIYCYLYEFFNEN